MQQQHTRNASIIPHLTTPTTVSPPKTSPQTPPPQPVHPNPTPTHPIQANDVFFALHALILVTLTGIQALVYDRGGQRLSTVGFLVGATIVTASLASAAIVVDYIPESLAAPEANAGARLPWYSLLNWLYLLSGVKVAVTFFKYMPQVGVGGGIGVLIARDVMLS